MVLACPHPENARPADNALPSTDLGSYPKELAVLGIKEYRQTWFKPYRVVYRVVGDRVLVYLITDGRRDMQLLLARRLLGAS